MTSSQIGRSKRVILRPISETDGETLFYYRNITNVALYQDWAPESPQEVRAYAQEMAKRAPFAVGEWYQIAIVEKISEQIIGDLAVCIDKETKQTAELGIALDPKYQRQGFAKEAVWAICDYLFSNKELHRIHASIDPRNDACLRLFSSIGFREEGVHIESYYSKGEWCDDLVMAILKREWINRPDQPQKEND